MRVLIAGWFSFDQMGATAGDLIARDIVCDWLNKEGIAHDIAVAAPYYFPGSVDWQNTSSDTYTDVIFVCGPFGNGWPATDLLDHFPTSRFSGVNLSLMQSLEEWNPFTFLYERDSSRTVNPDITFYAPPPVTPVVGIVLAHKQKEYKERAMHEVANSAIERLTKSTEMSVVPIDTALESNAGGLKTPREIEALISRMDLVITTRLHGTVLSLKNGVPVIPIDPIAGGAKITAQVKTLDWPLLFNVENLDDKKLQDALTYCLTDDARQTAKACALRAVQRIEELRLRFVNDCKALGM